jgi:hypothetical protein
MFTIALALAFAGAPVGAGRPPINPPGIDCPKGFIFKRGDCWRRTTDDISVFTFGDDEDRFEQEIERRIDELDRKWRRR